MIVGIDLSLNHAAAHLLNAQGKPVDFAYFTNVAGSANRAPFPTAARLPAPPKDAERQMVQMARLAWVKNWLESVVLDRWKPKYVGIEDYAIRVENGAHYMGEIGGIARMLCWERGVHFRLHDPITVKMATTHDGTAQKDLVERKVLERWGQDFSRYNVEAKKGKKPNRCTSEDLADAFAIAKLIWTEIQLRSGKLAASVLHPKEVQAFNRITNTYHVSLLGREWICNPDGRYNSASDVLRRVEEKHKEFRAKAPGTAADKLISSLLGVG